MSTEPPTGDGVEAADRGDEVRGVESGPTRQRTRGRTFATWVLVVLACLLAILSVVVVYARNQLLNTDTFVATVAPLAKDHAIQTAVATRVSNNLLASADLHSRVEHALPTPAGFLAGPITSAVKTATYQITLNLVESSEFQKLWEAALRRSHAQLDNLLLGRSVGALNASNGEVTVNLAQVQETATKALAAHGLAFFEKIPTYTGAPFVLFQSEQLAKLQRWIRILNDLAFVLPIASVLLFAASVLVSRNRRKGLVHAASGLAVSMALLLVATNVGRNQYLNSLKPSQPRAAAAAVIDTVDAKLLDAVRVILIVAVVVALVAFIVGLAPVRRAIERGGTPRWLTGGPVHDVVARHRKAFQWGVIAIGLIVLVLWNQPTVLVALIVVLVSLFVVMLVGLYGAQRSTSGEEDTQVGSGSDSEATLTGPPPAG